ncbi:MAG TPA: hypothetical protein VFV73_01665 [Streptosporangiaceae bacterium]|nr:hypothetical protein [Streptosporangiaceae bacterium]
MDLSLLDRLPILGDILPSLPPALKARLFTVFDMEVLWNKPGGQATVTAEITEATLDAFPALLDPSQDGYHDTHPASADDLTSMCQLPASPEPAMTLTGRRPSRKALA